MSELLQLLDQSLDLFGSRVAAVTDWDAEVPGLDWTTRELVMHLVDEHRWAPPLLAGHDVDTARGIVEGTADRGGPDRNWQAAQIESRRAFHEPGVLDQPVELARGTTSAAVYLSEMIQDLVIHSWDLGGAIGIRDPLPDVLVDFAYAALQDAGDLSGGGYFSEPVPVSDDATKQDRMIALSGRHPR